jgi:hypothetical protein
MNPRALKRDARAVYVFLAVAIPLLGGCLERELKPLNPCLVSGVVAEIAVTNVDKIDLLFMVDNSFSMEQEQSSLREQFPRLINILTTGDKDGDMMPDFPPAKDLHLGVVTSDLGLPGLEGARIENCGNLGDEGRLQNMSNPDLMAEGLCSSAMFNPPFLQYDAESADDATRTRLANDFSCLAAVGLEGCGFEQQLESTLKAVWPGADQNVTFVTDPGGFGMFGMAGPGFPNGEFIRNDPNQGPSLIALVLVTDEEDCSSRRMDHFAPMASTNGLNTRCFYEGKRGADSNLFQVNRYIELFKMLRPNQENLVIFAGIVGVPPQLTQDLPGEEDFVEQFDFDVPGESTRYFDAILADPEMEERVDDKGTPMLLDDDGIIPSCNRGEFAKAYPPRRIVEVAKGFGSNGVIHSICTDDFTPAVNAIIDVIAKQLGTVCLPRPLVRNSKGLVGCNVVWELPKTPGGGAPTACNERPEFLLPPDPGRPAVGEGGRAVCKVAQLAVADLDTPNAAGDTKAPVVPTLNGDIMATEGWYYDEFSADTKMECTGDAKQRITFTPNAQPPTGVIVKLECLNETQSLANTRTDIRKEDDTFKQAKIGSPCEMVERRNPVKQEMETVSGNEACQVFLSDNTIDEKMFCHMGFQVCVLRCNTDADCPAAWVCDDRGGSVEEAGEAYCTNPTCGGDQ